MSYDYLAARERRKRSTPAERMAKVWATRPERIAIQGDVRERAAREARRLARTPRRPVNWKDPLYIEQVPLTPGALTVEEKRILVKMINP